MIFINLTSLEAWKNGSPEQIEKSLNALSPEAHKLLLEDRTMDWMYRNQIGNYKGLVEKLEHDSSVSIGVGAGHLFGEKGLLKLFEAEGFTVTRIDTSSAV